MAPRRLSRWKSFWFGILVLGFLGWAWMSSMDRLHWLEVSSPEGGVRVIQFEGELIITWERDRSWWDASAGIDDDKGSANSIRDYWRRDESAVGLAHCILMLCFFVPWTSFLAWRWRRMGREAEGCP